MTPLATETFHQDMAEAVLSADRSAAPAWLDAEGAYRFRVYRNNLRHGLAGTLAEAFPVVRRLVGAEFFEAAAGVFIERHPPKDRMLSAFGGDFADFLDAFEPARSVPYLGDIARLERARIEALHAADADPLDPSALATLGEGIVIARFEPHPAVRLLNSQHPVLSIWQANARRNANATSIEARPEAVLITRPGLELHVAKLSAGEAAFAAGLLQGDTAEDAHGAAAVQAPDFDPMTAFRTLLTAGAFRGLKDTTRYQIQPNTGP
jgi:hypothetical protein